MSLLYSKILSLTQKVYTLGGNLKHVVKCELHNELRDRKLGNFPTDQRSINPFRGYVVNLDLIAVQVLAVLIGLGNLHRLRKGYYDLTLIWYWLNPGCKGISVIFWNAVQVLLVLIAICVAMSLPNTGAMSILVALTTVWIASNGNVIAWVFPTFWRVISSLSYPWFLLLCLHGWEGDWECLGFQMLFFIIYGALQFNHEGGVCHKLIRVFNHEHPLSCQQHYWEGQVLAIIQSRRVVYSETTWWRLDIISIGYFKLAWPNEVGGLTQQLGNVEAGHCAIHIEENCDGLVWVLGVWEAAVNEDWIVCYLGVIPWWNQEGPCHVIKGDQIIVPGSAILKTHVISEFSTEGRGWCKLIKGKAEVTAKELVELRHHISAENSGCQATVINEQDKGDVYFSLGVVPLVTNQNESVISMIGLVISLGCHDNGIIQGSRVLECEYVRVDFAHSFVDFLFQSVLEVPTVFIGHIGLELVEVDCVQRVSDVIDLTGV